MGWYDELIDKMFTEFSQLLLPSQISWPENRERTSANVALLRPAALLLARETKALLIGEAAHPHVRRDILRIAAQDPAIRHANGGFTVQLGPDSVVATLSAEFEDALATPEVEACVNRIEAAVCETHPDVVALYVKPQTAEVWRRRMARLHDEDTPLP